MTFAFNGQAQVKHVNLRKEGATDAKHVAADIKLQAIADATILAPFNEHLEGLLFTPAGEPRIVNLEPIALDGSIKHLGCDFTEWGVAFRDAEAKRFVFEPMTGRRVVMTFSVAIEPQGAQTAKLAEMLGETVRVSIGVESDLLREAAPVLPAVGITELSRKAVALGHKVAAARASLELEAMQLADAAATTDAKRAAAKKSRRTKTESPLAALASPPRTWSHKELRERIPTMQPAGTDGDFLVLRAISHTHGPDGIESIELRINALDADLLRVQVGYQINRGGRTRTSPPLNNIRSMLEDALHDALQVIAEKEAWRDLAEVVTGWPLSKRFRNLGVQAWR